MPIQVFIDGIPQIESPTVVKKPASAQEVPITPDFEQEIKEAVQYEGLPPLAPQATHTGMVMFTNITSLYMKTTVAGDAGDEAVVVEDLFQSNSINLSGPGIAVIENGRLKCYGASSHCARFAGEAEAVIDLQGGALQPALAAAGTPLGLQEIGMEEATTDGTAPNILSGEAPSIFAVGQVIPRAVDGLMLGTRDSL